MIGHRCCKQVLAAAQDSDVTVSSLANDDRAFSPIEPAPLETLLKQVEEDAERNKDTSSTTTSNEDSINGEQNFKTGLCTL